MMLTNYWYASEARYRKEQCNDVCERLDQFCGVASSTAESQNNNNIVYELEIGKPLLGDLCNTDQTPSELQVAERG